MIASICALARAQPGIKHSNGLLTVHVGPRQVVAALSIDFDDRLSAGEVESTVARLEQQVRQMHPEITTLLIKPQSMAAFESARARTFHPEE